VTKQRTQRINHSGQGAPRWWKIVEFKFKLFRKSRNQATPRQPTARCTECFDLAAACEYLHVYTSYTSFL